MSDSHYRRRGEVIRADILHSLICLGPCTLADLVDDTGRTPKSVETQLRALLADGRVERYGRQRTGRKGAPRTIWRAT